MFKPSVGNTEKAKNKHGSGSYAPLTKCKKDRDNFFTFFIHSHIEWMD